MHNTQGAEEKEVEVEEEEEEEENEAKARTEEQKKQVAALEESKNFKISRNTARPWLGPFREA